MKIETWKEILTPNGLRPILFFNPSLGFITYCKNNNYSNVPIKITGTDGVYDGIYYVSIDIKTDKIYCGSSSVITPLKYTAILNRDFTIIPTNKGYLSIAFENTAVVDPQQKNDRDNFVSSDINIEGALDVSPTPKSETDAEQKSGHDVFFGASDVTPTPTSMKNCTKGSLNQWQVICVFILILILIVYYFYKHF